MKTSRDKGRRGAALVEASFGLILFFTILVGIMEFGRMVWIQNTLVDLAREGARYACCHGSQSKQPATAASVRTEVLRYNVGLDPNSLTVTTTWTPNNDPGSKVSVAVSYTADSVTSWVSFPQMSSTSTMYISW